MSCTWTCHCGDVRVTVPAPPAEISQCNCSICVKLSTRWAYYERADVVITGALQGYRRADMSEPALETMRCARCGCVTHWQALDPSIVRCGVNLNLLPPDLIEGLPVRMIDGRSWPIE